MSPRAVLCLLGLLAICAPALSTLVNKDVVRRIDISKSVARHFYELEIENTGSEAVSQFVLAFPSTIAGHLSFIEAESNQEKLVVSAPFDNEQNKDAKFYRVTLNTAVAPKSTVRGVVRCVFNHVLTPLPAEIAQAENQLVVYADNHFFYSPYTTRTQKTEVKLFSSTVEEYSREKPTKQSGDTITYGPYKNKEPFSHSDMRIHYLNNSPFLSVNALEREIEVSHWGNIAVTEHYYVMHEGAKLKGHFSRIDYQRPGAQDVAPAVIRSFVAVLPSAARDIYYRDEIGNISSSTVRPGATKGTIEVELTPRFPLFGGWKTDFILGYNLPLAGFLSSGKDQTVLSHKFGAHIEGPVDSIKTKVILPEGSRNVELHSPYTVDSEATDVHKTYLDTTGRPVIAFEKTNMATEHKAKFAVHYNFSRLSMLQEPLLLMAGFFSIFLFFIVINRHELRITKNSQEKAKTA